MKYEPERKKYGTGEKHTVKMVPVQGAVIVYGHGADLGDFKVFADHLKRELSKKYGENVLLFHCIEKAAFMDFFEKTEFEFMIAEAHVFCHAFGAGLALGYHVPAFDAERIRIIELFKYQKGVADFDTVLETEKGILFTDDLLQPFFSAKKEGIRKKFSPNSSMKIWGCNSGISGWTYSDNPDWPYWEVLNSKNRPKPSIAWALAEFFNIVTMGAKSGSHVEVENNGTWITSSLYKQKYGTFPPPSLNHRLVPDKGGYYAYNP